MVGETVGGYWEENYTFKKIERQNCKLQSEHKYIETSRPPLDLTPVGAKTSFVKKPATDSLSRK